jgi:3-methylcrotonyl-CoA carboxylase alpha subunit
MKVRFQFLGAPVEAEVVREGGRLAVQSPPGGRPFEFRLDGGDLIVELDGAVRRLPFARVKDRLYLHLDGKVWEFAQAEQGFAAKAGSEKFDGKVYPPMPGNVVKVMVAAGDTVEKGRPLVIIESMKMEHTVEAPEAGKVLEVRAATGTVADLTAPMIVMEIAPAGEGAK